MRLIASRKSAGSALLSISLTKVTWQSALLATTFAVNSSPLASDTPVATPSAVNRTALRAPLDVKRFVLWGSLVAAALLLGYMALRLARQMRTGSDDA